MKITGKPTLKLYAYIANVFDGGLEDTDEDSNQSLEMQRLDDAAVGGSKGAAYCDTDDLDRGSEEWHEVTSDWSKLGNEGEDNSGKGKVQKQDSLDYRANTP